MTTLMSEQTCFAKKTTERTQSCIHERLLRRDIEVSLIRVSLEKLLNADSLNLYQDPEDELFVLHIIIQDLQPALEYEVREEWFQQIRFAIWDLIHSHKATAYEIAKEVLEFLKTSPKSAHEIYQQGIFVSCHPTINLASWFSKGVQH